MKPIAALIATIVIAVAFFVASVEPREGVVMDKRIVRGVNTMYLVFVRDEDGRTITIPASLETFNTIERGQSIPIGF